MGRKKYPHIGRKERPLDAGSWEQAYLQGEVHWDHGEPSPGLVDFLAHEKWVSGTALVPGCGFGHDCRLLAHRGFTVTGLDVSPSAVEQARKLSAKEPAPILYVVGDFLAGAMEGREFDWVVEHTCFCAIDPDLRDRYVLAALAALKPGGHLLGVFYNIQPESGPPFGTTRGELLDRFGPHLTLIHEKVPRSYTSREGKEILMLWKKDRA